MKLYVARHAQTNYNVHKLLNSDPNVDVRLTDLGIQQAQQLAERLAGVTFDVIYISELPRTRETAGYLPQYSHTPVVVDARLNDHASGFEGKTTAEYLEAFHQATNKWHTRFNDGESLADAKARVESFMNDLRAQKYRSVLVVTHGYIVECIHAIVSDISFEEASLFQITQGDFAVYNLTS